MEKTSIQIDKSELVKIKGNKSAFVRDAIRTKLMTEGCVSRDDIELELVMLKAKRKIARTKQQLNKQIEGDLDKQIGTLIILKEKLKDEESYIN